MSETSHRGSRSSKAAEAPEAEAATTTETEATPAQSEAAPATAQVDEVAPEGDAAPPEQPEVLVSQLVARAPEFLGYPSHTAMGALSDSLDQTMTAEQAKAKVEEWLQQPVQVEEE